MFIYFFEELLPIYLAAITPVVVLDNEECPKIRLVFPCSDQPPSVMVLHDTWEMWCTAWQTSPPTLELKPIEQSLHSPSHTNSNIPKNFHEMLTFHKSYSNDRSDEEESTENRN